MPTIGAGMVLSLLFEVKHCSIQCLIVLCFPGQFQHQGAMGRSVWTSIPSSQHRDDLYYPPCSQILPWDC